LLADVTALSRSYDCLIGNTTCINDVDRTDPTSAALLTSMAFDHHQHLGQARHSVASTTGMVLDLGREVPSCNSDTAFVGQLDTNIGIVAVAVVGLPDTGIVGPSTENGCPVFG